MLKLFEKEFTDPVYLKVLADFLEETGHPWAEAARLLADEICFLYDDDRSSTPPGDRYDLFCPKDIDELDGANRVGLGVYFINKESEYVINCKKYEGMNRFSFHSPTAALESLSQYLRSEHAGDIRTRISG